MSISLAHGPQPTPALAAGGSLLPVLLGLATLLLLALALVLLWQRARLRELEHRRSQRGLELERVNEELRRAVDARGRFLATVSHEIRTPLNGILGLSQLLQEDAAGPEQAEIIRLLRDSGMALKRLLDGLLDLSRIEAGRLQLEQAAVDLHQLASEVMRLHAAGARARGIYAGVFVDPGVPRIVTGDGQRLAQVLGNLLSNALKFTSGGHVLLALRPAPEPGGGGEIIFDVIDSGPGLSEAQLGRLFQPFSQVHGRAGAEGSGLGLAISRGIAGAMGGRIDVESVPGRGSRFSLVVPVQARAAEDRRFRLSGRSVVVWSADVEIGRALSAHFESEGASVSRAPHPWPAGHRPDWIVHLPGDQPEDDLARLPRPRQGVVRLVGAGAHPQHGEAVQRTLPVIAHELVALMAGEAAMKTGVSRAVPESRPRGRRVLVVDDNEVNLQVAGRMVQRLGYEVELARDGDAALGLLDTRCFDLVLMDCLMPEPDGFETTRRLRQRIPPEVLPVVALTAGAFAGERKECLAAGMNDYLTKPVDAATLQRVLDRWIPNDQGAIGDESG